MGFLTWGRHAPTPSAPTPTFTPAPAYSPTFVPGEASLVPEVKSSPLAHQSEPTLPHSPPYLGVGVVGVGVGVGVGV